VHFRASGRFGVAHVQRTSQFAICSYEVGLATQFCGRDKTIRHVLLCRSIVVPAQYAKNAPKYPEFIVSVRSAGRELHLLA
jgi:hypothetical protein